MAGKAKVYKTLNTICPKVICRLLRGIFFQLSINSEQLTFIDIKSTIVNC